MIELSQSELSEGADQFAELRCPKHGGWIDVSDRVAELESTGGHVECLTPGCGWQDDVHIVRVELPVAPGGSVEFNASEDIGTGDKMI